MRGIIGIRATVCWRLKGSLCRLFHQRGISSDSNDVRGTFHPTDSFYRSIGSLKRSDYYENYVRLRACSVFRHWPVKNVMTFFHVRSRVRDAKWNAGTAINRQRRVVDSHFSGLPLETCAVLVYNPKLEWRSKPIPKSGWKNRGKERSVNERSTGYEIKPRCVQNQNKHIYELSMAITHARFE